jgi:hypothetical protein
MPIPYIETNTGISAFLCGRQHIVSNQVKYFPEFLKAVQENDDEVQALEILNSNLKRMTEALKLTADIRVEGGRVLYKDEPVESVISERMVAMLDEEKPMQYMVTFLDNLMQNPSFRATQQLYPFLEFGRNPITPDGCFLAYKAVRENYFDIHSGKFDNSVGATPSMPRNRVNEDPHQTCSAGLHVCSFDYLPNFSHANGHVMVVKVNPRDVVAIPVDYNNTKMRVSAYTVVGEYRDYYLEHPECAFNTAVVDDFEQFGDQADGGGTPTFAVEVYPSEEKLNFNEFEDIFGRTDLELQEAKEDAIALDADDYYRVLVRNEHTDSVVMTLNGNAK